MQTQSVSCSFSRRCSAAVFATLCLLCIPVPGAMAQSEKTPVKLCVASVRNTSNYSVDTRTQQARLVQAFNNAKKDKKGKLASVDAVPIVGQDPQDAASQAREVGCSDVLYTNVVSLRSPTDAQRQPSPNINRGGVTSPGNISIGRDPVTAYPGGDGVNSHDPVFEAQVDFQVYKLDRSDPILASSAHAVEHTGEDGAVSSTMDVVVNRTRGALARQ